MKRQRSESGQIAVILALAMVGLLAFTALANFSTPDSRAYLASSRNASCLTAMDAISLTYC